MKSIIIFYSLEGNTRLVTEKMAKTINCDILELKTKSEIKTGALSKYIWGGKQVLFKEKPELIPITEDINKYDLIIFGSPIWAGKYAPAFNTFLDNNIIKNKKIALFNCNGGGGTKKFFQEFKNILSSNEVIGEISFKDPLKENTEDNLKQAEDWIKTIIKKV